MTSAADTAISLPPDHPSARPVAASPSHPRPAAAARAILFDFGDTLAHFGEIDRKVVFRRAAWRTYCLWAKRQRRMPGFRRYYLHQWFAMHWGLLKLALLGREIDARYLLRRSARKLWLEGDDGFFEKLIWHWYRPLADQATVEPGTYETLCQLRDAGYELGLVSNTFVPSHAMDRHLDQLGLLELFPARIYSCDVGYRKPHRRIFDIALEQMGIAPEQAIFVGDLVKADVRGANRAGLKSIWRKPPHQPNSDRDHEADAVINSIRDLPRVIRQLNRG